MSKPIRQRDKWRIRWTDHAGKRKSEVFAEFRDAQFQLRRHEREAEEIRRGLRLGLTPDKTGEDLCNDWTVTRVPSKRSGHHDESIIRAHIRPFFGEMLLRDITGEVIHAFKAQLGDLSPKTIWNILTQLRAMLAHAVYLNWLIKVPTLLKPELDEVEFRYLRTAEELDRFLRAADAEGDLVGAFYRTAVYTGMRAGEIAALRWNAIDLEKRLITVARSFDGPTKSRRVRHLPILDALLPTLQNWRLRCPGNLVFPNQVGTMYGRSSSIFKVVFHRVLDSAGFERVERNGKLRWYVVFHDLRHTFASHWVMNGGDIFRLQRILGHQSIQMTQRYAHLAPEEWKKDWGRFGPHTLRPPGVVVSIPLPASSSAGPTGTQAPSRA